MSDLDYDAAVDSVLRTPAAPKAPQGAPDLGYDSAVDTVLAGQTQTANRNLAAATRFTPEQAGKIHTMARDAGLPAYAVEGNEAAVLSDLTARKNRDLMAKDPVLARAIANNPAFADIAFDDMQNAADVADAWAKSGFGGASRVARKTEDRKSEIFRAVSPGGVTAVAADYSLAAKAELLSKSAKSGFESLKSATAGIASAVLGGVTEAELAALYKDDPDGLQRAREAPANFLNNIALREARKSSATMRGLSPGVQAGYGEMAYATLPGEKAAYLSPTKILADVVQSLPSSVALMVTAYFTRGAAAKAEQQALAAGAAPEVARKAGVDAAVLAAQTAGGVGEGAQSFAQAKYSVQAQTEDMPAAAWDKSPLYTELRAAGYSDSAAKLATAAQAGQLAGAGGGMLTGAISVIGGRFLGKAIGEGGNVATRAGKGFLAEAGAEAPQSAGEQFFENVAKQQFLNKDQDVLEGVAEATLQGLFVGGASGALFSTSFGRAQADADVDKLNALMDLVAQSAAKPRDPVTFQNFMAGVTDNTTVFINAEELRNTLAQNQMDSSILPSLEEQLSQPSVTGDVEIPIGELMTAFAGTPAQEQVVQHARIRQDDMSAADHAAYGGTEAEFFKKQAAVVMEKQKANEQFTTERAEIEADIVAKLQSLAPLSERPFNTRDFKYQASLLGAFYATAADLMGTTPKQVAAQWAPKILGTEAAPAEAGLTQGFSHGNAMLNVGLDVGATDRAQKIDAAFVEAELNKMGVQVLSAKEVEGEYEYEGKAVKELTYVPQLSRPLTEAEVNALAIATGQEAIGHYAGGVGNLWGPNAANWGDFNPEFFKDQAGESLADNNREWGKPIAQSVADVAKAVKLFAASKKVIAEFAPYAPYGAATGLELTDLFADELGTGAGSQVMTYLSELADQESLAVYLHPSSARNTEFYQRFGFEKSRTAFGVLVRYPPLPGYEDDALAQSQSSRRPTAKRAPEDHLGEVPLTVDYTKIEDDKHEQNMALVAKYPGIRFKARKAAGRAEEFIQHVTNNLLWLHDQIPAEIRQRSKLWYDGARAITDRWTKKYGKSDSQIAAVLAIYSPQKDWFMNVSLAERTLDIVQNQQNTPWSAEMSAAADKILADEKFAMLRGAIEGKKLSELKDRLEQAAWLRTFDEAHNNRGHRLVTPEGGFVEFAVSTKNVEKKTGWPGFGTIVKALYVLDDGSPKMIDNALGAEHKVRSFYNNILHPTSDLGFVTIDTHAVAAGLLRPLSGNSVEVTHNFGGAGAASSAATGMSGTYAYYQEAYRRAAEARGLLPREMQSIAWEAVRELYTSGFKRDTAKMAVVDKLWSEYEKGKRDLDSVRAGILNLAGGVEQPAWVGHDSGISPEGWASTYTGELLGDSVPGRDTGGVDAGAGERAAAGISDKLKNHEAAVAEYNALNNTELGLTTEGGRVLNTDLARELSPGYQANRALSQAVHEPASAFIKKLYAEKLAAPTPEGLQPVVVFTAGGTGAGKSSGLKHLGALGDVAEIVYDTNMSTLASSTKKIEQALAAGRRVVVNYTYRDPVEALTGGALPRAMRMGRTVPLVEHVKTHVGSREVIAQLGAKYQGDARVEFVHVDNSNGRDEAVVKPLAEIPEVLYPELQEKLNEALNKEHQAGRISPVVYAAFRADAEAVRPDDGAGDRGQPQPRGAGGDLAQHNRNVGAVAGPVVGVHYSQHPRTSLASSAFGSGMPGAERARLAAATDPRIKQRVAFYVNTGNGITPESGVGPHAHEATLRNLYDADADALKIWRNSKGDMNAAESAVLDAGFDGYLTRNFGGTGAVVMLGSRSVDVQGIKKEDVSSRAEIPPSAEIPKMKQAAMAIVNNRALPFGRQSVESWKRDIERSDPDTAALIKWDEIPAGDYYKDQIAAQLWQKTWYYSALQRALEKAPAKVFSTGKATAQWLTANAGKMGVKAAELEATGVTDWLETQGKVTQEQVVSFVKQGGVQVREVMLGEVYDADVEAWWGDEGGANEETPFDELSPEEQAEAREQYRTDVQSYGDNNGTKFETYQLPGGANYKELLITLPPDHGPYEAAQAEFKAAEKTYHNAVVAALSTTGDTSTDPEVKRTGALLDAAKAKFAASTTKVFNSSHYPGTPNILAHLRFNERVDADGKRVLFIEEIQSDWAQKGRKEGFQTDTIWLVYNAKKKLHHSFMDKAAAEVEAAKVGGYVEAGGKKGVPSAPFVTDTQAWTALALKRTIAYAVDNGFDRVAWTTGEQQAARYDLSKTLSKVVVSKQGDLFKIGGTDLRGDVHDFGAHPAEKLEDVVGKDLAAKIMQQKTPNDVYAGNDLKVGGEGMKAFYDQIVPQVANDVLKKIGGGKVGTVDLGGFPRGTEEATRKISDEQMGFDITPAMRDLVSAQGLPLFAGQQEEARRGSFNPLTFDLRLLADANRSTFIHELSHFFMAAYIDMASQPDAPPQLTQFVEDLLGYLFKTVPGGEQVGGEGLGQKVGAGETALLAPNGKPSKLNAQQWKQVRTPEFKAWFGDWEKHARAKNPVGSLWSDDSVSKIVDENGEPLVVYHGTQQGGFDIFRPEKGDKHRSPMVFATDDPGTARSYSGRPGEIEVQDQQAIERWEELRSAAAYNEKKLTKAERAELRKLDAVFNTEDFDPTGVQRGVYHLFLNIKNPNEADFEGANWDGQLAQSRFALTQDNVETGEYVETEEEAESAVEDGRADGYYEELARGDTTNSVAEEALRFEQDGAIIRNVTDDGGKHGYGVDPSDVFVFFDSNQVKSATQNTGAFSRTDDSILRQDGQPTMPGAIPEGRTNLERWNAMTLDQQRAYWEFFAEGFEQYAMSGKAPTKALQSAFSAFAKWMKEIYKTLKNFVTMHGTKPLDAELTQYFDRMLATDEELDAARAERGFQALFKRAAEAGMSPGQFADYMALDDLQRVEAEELLRSRSLRDMKWLSNAKTKAMKELQAEADELRALVQAGVEEELANTPIRQAERWLRKGEMVQDGEQIKAAAGHRLDTAILKAMFPEGAIAGQIDFAKLGRGSNALASTTGTQHPDDVAAIFGFRNGEDLVRQLIEMQPFKEEVQQLTDLRMLEEHGDLASPQAIAKAADEAIHNDAHLKMVATEVWALGNRTGSVAMLTRAAKAFAAQLVDNTVVKKLSPSQYANAATRAGKAAVRALAKKEVDKAANEKRTEMVNAAAAKAAYAAEAEVRAIVNRLRKISAYSDKHSATTSREFGVVQAVRAILSDFGIGQHGEKATKYLNTLSEYDPVLGAVLDDVINKLAPEVKPWDQLKVADLRELHAAINGLWTVARDVRSVELAGEKMSLDDARAQLIAKLEETQKTKAPAKAFSLTKAEERNQDFMSFAAKAIRPESWISTKDGLDSYGPWRRLIWNTIDRAQLAYNADKTEKLKQLKALLEPIAADMVDVKIDAPELGGTFGAGRTIGYSELLHAILHTGNLSNKTKLLLGRGWGSLNEDGTLNSAKWDAFMSRMFAEGRVTKAHMGFVQATWDLLESMKKGAQEAHKATTGRYFEEIEATPLVTPYGTYRGGYAPAIVDHQLVAEADLRKMQNAAETEVIHSFEKPAGGFTKSRVAGYNQPLELNIAALGRHIDQVLLFSRMSIPVRNVQRVLKGKDLSSALAEQDRAALGSVLAPWLHSAATQTVTEKGKLSYESLSLFTKARSRAGAAIMFANVSNSVQQLTGFFPATLKVSKKELLFAAAKGWYKPRELAASAAEMSPYMQQRLANEVHAMAEEIDHILLNPTKFEKAQDWAIAHSYFLQMAVDTAMSPIIWQAKFNEETARGAALQEAVDLADAAVRMTQGTNRAIDIAAMEKGSPFYRMFMQFAGYFNTQANLVGEKLAAEALLPNTPAKYGRIGMILAMGWWAPAIATALIVQLFRGGVDDDDQDGEWLDDWLVSTFIGSPIRYAVAAIPVFGTTINAAVNSFNNKPYDDRISVSPAVSLVEGGFRGAQAAYGAIEDPTKAGRAIRDLGTFLSLFTGVPVTPATRAAGFATDVETGKVSPTSGADYARGIITGVASPESKR